MTDGSKIAISALLAELRGIIPSRTRGPGQGAASVVFSWRAEGKKQSATRKTTLTIGTENRAHSQTGQPASRNRRAVIASPTPINGIAASSIAAKYST